MVDESCYFSTGVDDNITCSKELKFDEYGFPEVACSSFPCQKVLNVEISRREEEERRANQAQERAGRLAQVLNLAVDHFEKNGHVPEVLIKKMKEELGSKG